MRSDVHVYLFNISIQGTPDFDFIACGSEETKSVFDISATNYGILVSSDRVVVFVVIIEPDGLSSEN